jgi:hypothetical protein
MNRYPYIYIDEDGNRHQCAVRSVVEVYYGVIRMPDPYDLGEVQKLVPLNRIHGYETGACSAADSMAVQGMTDPPCATDREFFSTVLAMRLPAGFELLQPKIKGMVIDGLWKDVLLETHGEGVLIPEQGLAFDAQRVSSGRYGDVKFCSGAYSTEYEVGARVYISHGEYLFGKKHDTMYIVYAIASDSPDQASLLCTFSFTEAKDAEAIKYYPEGKTWSFCQETGKQMAPWSIELFLVHPGLRKVLVPAAQS